MKNILSLKRVAVLVLASVFLFTNSITAFASKFTSTEGNFSINFPGTPKVESEPVKTVVGTVIMYSFSYAPSTDKAFLIAYGDYAMKAPNRPESYKLLKNVQSGQMDSFKMSKASQEKKNLYKKHAGFFYKADDKKTYVASQSYLVENRLYQIMILSEKPIKIGEINSFIKSFKLLEK